MTMKWEEAPLVEDSGQGWASAPLVSEEEQVTEPAPQEAPVEPEAWGQGGNSVQKMAGTADAAATFVTSMYGRPVSGLAGAGRLMGSSFYKPFAKMFGLPYDDPVESAVEKIEQVSERMIHQPKTKEGEELVEAASYPFMVFHQAGKYMGEKIDDPFLSTIVSTAIEGAPEIAMGGALIWKGRATPRVDLSPKVTATIDRVIDKGVRPSTAGKQTFSQIKKYKEQARSAVEDIVRHSDDLKLTDIDGNPIEGLPSNLHQFSQAVEQVRLSIFEEYNALAEAANGKGVLIDVTNVIEVLNEIAADPSVKMYSKGVSEYARMMSESIAKNPHQSAMEVQNGIGILNERLNAFYKSPSYENASFANVDSVIASHLRKNIDSAIEGSVGEGYGALKRRYGSLKAIEKDVNRRAVVDSRGGVSGFLDFTDIYTSSEVVHGILSANPALVGKGLAGRMVKQLWKRRKDPNRMVKNMFGDVNKAIRREAQRKIPAQDVEYGGPTYEQPTVPRIEYNPKGEGVIELPRGPIQTKGKPVSGYHKSETPPSPNVTLRPSHETIPVSPKGESIFPDQLATVREGKSALSNARNQEAGVGPDLIVPGAEYYIPYTPSKPSITPIKSVEHPISTAAKRAKVTGKTTQGDKAALGVKQRRQVSDFREKKGLGASGSTPMDVITKRRMVSTLKRINKFRQDNGLPPLSMKSFLGE